jgi:hypothetical protein
VGQVVDLIVEHPVVEEVLALVLLHHRVLGAYRGGEERERTRGGGEGLGDGGDHGGETGWRRKRQRKRGATGRTVDGVQGGGCPLLIARQD